MTDARHNEPTTDDIVEQARRVRARRRATPWIVKAIFHGVDLGTFVLAPAIGAWIMFRFGKMTAEAMWTTATVGTMSTLRMWMHRSPLLTELGLRGVEDP